MGDRMQEMLNGKLNWMIDQVMINIRSDFKTVNIKIPRNRNRDFKP